MSNVPLSHGMLIASRSDSAIADQPFPIVTQELKSFRDINVVDAEPGYILRVMVVENKATAGSVGYTLSVLVTPTIQDDVLRTPSPTRPGCRFCSVSTVRSRTSPIIGSHGAP
jgi:hypothetical protein